MSVHPLAFSCLALRRHSIGGVEQMALDLLAGLEEVGAAVIPILHRSQDPYLAAHAAHIPGWDRRVQLGGTSNRFVAEELAPFWALREPHDLLFPNAYTPFLRPRTTRRVITVVHDLLSLDLPGMISAKRRHWRRLSVRRSLFSADAVVCISAFTRDRILHHFGDRHRDKLHVIPNPVDMGKFGDTDAAPRRHPRRYILSVANHFPHKNLLTLVEAFKRVAQRIDDIDLLLVGQMSSQLGDSAYSQALATKVDESARIVMTGYVSDAELGALYRDAELFAMPTLYEGFGRSLVEATAMGVPVLASDLPVFREIWEGALAFVDEPSSIDAWEAGLEHMLRNPMTVTPDMRRTFAARFAPARIARDYLDLVAGLDG